MRQDEIFPPNLQYYFRKAKREEEERRQEKDKASRRALGGYFYSLSKLVFSAMVLVGATSLITGETNPSSKLLMLLGSAFTAFFAVIAYKIYK